MTKKNKETLELKNNKSHCYGCGNELRNHSILVCAECLEGECEEFFKLARTIDKEE